MLDGKRFLITGVLTRKSIAFAVARELQLAGAEVLLTGFGRTRRMTARAAPRLPEPADVIELDINSEEDLAGLAGEIEDRWGGLDGALHAIAFAPADAIGGRFMETPAESALEAFRTSAYSYKALAGHLAPLMEDGGSFVGLDFDASVAWSSYDWMGVSKAALESVNRYLARDLGPRGVRCNLVAAGPLNTMAARRIDGFDELAGIWEQTAPLGWDLDDPTSVAAPCLFLPSPLSRAVTGAILHADGGVHAVGASAS